MKHFILSSILLIALFNVASGQEYKKSLKNANKILGKYYSDPVVNKAALSEAMTILDQVFKTDEAQADADAWNTRGQIFNEIASSEMLKRDLDSKLNKIYVIASPMAGIEAVNSFNKAIKLALKKSQTKDALVGLIAAEQNINNIGIVHFQDQNYTDAFLNFNTAVEVYNTLKQNGEKSRLDDPAIKKDHYFYTAIAAMYGDHQDKAAPLFEEVYKMGNADALVYESLFTLTAEKDEVKAMKYLEEGRKAYPQESGLLFAEINYYLKVGKLDVLTDKLKAAIEKEPSNVSVYTTLGNVYDQLNQKERTDKNFEKAEEYFGEAFKYFNEALKIDDKNFDATYSLGALYYNKAASMTTQLNELSNDFSSAGTKKYNAVKKEMDGYFIEALPFFTKAEMLNPSDVNTMIALKEIYARSGDLEKSNMYKAKIEQSGN